MQSEGAAAISVFHTFASSKFALGIAVNLHIYMQMNATYLNPNIYIMINIRANCHFQ